MDGKDGIPGNAGADTRRFDLPATCMDYFLEPDRTQANDALAIMRRGAMVATAFLSPE